MINGHLAAEGLHFFAVLELGFGRQNRLKNEVKMSLKSHPRRAQRRVILGHF